MRCVQNISKEIDEVRGSRWNLNLFWAFAKVWYVCLNFNLGRALSVNVKTLCLHALCFNSEAETNHPKAPDIFEASVNLVQILNFNVIVCRLL